MKSPSRIIQRPLTEQIREVALSGEVTLPPLPEMGQRLVRLLQDEDRADAREIAKTVETDPAVVADLLRMANSAYFGGLGQVTDLQRAIARLGVRRVGTLVTTLVHKGQFETSDPFQVELLKILWHHAVATALAARRITRQAGGDPEESYLAGLLHDIGKLVALRAMDHLLAQGRDLELTHEIMNEVMDATHTELGYRLLSDWRFPDRICRAVFLHHDDQGEDDLAQRIQAADAVAKKIGAHPRPDPDLVLDRIPAVERLNLSEVELAALLVDVEDELENLRQLL